MADDKTSEEQATEAAIEFAWSNACDLKLFYFITNSALRQDYSIFVARQALDGNEYKDKDPATLAKEDPGIFTKELRILKQSIYEIFLSRLVQNFERYLVHIIHLTLKAEPRILWSEEKKVKISEIIEANTIENLMDHLIEETVSKLSFRGFKELTEWCNSRGIPLVFCSQDKNYLSELIALRNIIVHQRCIIDKKYALITGELDAIGQKRIIKLNEYLFAHEFIKKAVFDLDAIVSKKYSIDTSNVINELKKGTMMLEALKVKIGRLLIVVKHFLGVCTGKYDHSAFADSDAGAVIDTLADGCEVTSAAIRSKGKQLSPLAAGCLTTSSPG